MKRFKCAPLLLLTLTLVTQSILPSHAEGKPTAKPTPAATTPAKNGNTGQTQSPPSKDAAQGSQQANPLRSQSDGKQTTPEKNSSTPNQNASSGKSAERSTNPKLNPSLTSSSKANSKADKARSLSGDSSASCATNTAAAKAKAAKDPCSDFIVVFTPGVARSQSATLIKNAQGRIKQEFSHVLNGALVSGPLSKMQALSNNPNVLVVEDDLGVTAAAIQQSAPWGLDRIDQRALPINTTFDYGDSSGINSYSYVVDTGIDATNTDFGNRVAPGFTAILDGNGSKDCNGHGTHVAGIIGGTTYGVAKQTNLIPVRVLDCSGSGTYSSVISGLDWIAANYKAGDAAVVNMSLGGPISSTLDGAVKNLIAKGISVVVAAGNSNADACNYSPSRVTDAITVGATTDSDARASYSNFGSCVDLFAPGNAITSTWIGTSGTNTISGTSMASPHVAGIVARFISAYAGLTPQQVANSIKKSATQNIVTIAGPSTTTALSYLSITPDTSTAPADSSPTFTRVNPKGKIVGKSK